MALSEGLVVTGWGLVCPLGADVGTTWEALQFGKAPCTMREAGHETARVPCGGGEEEDRSLDLAVRAAREAAHAARLTGPCASKAACWVSSSKGGIRRLLDAASKEGRDAGRFLEAFFPHGANGRVREVLGLGGPALSLGAACATGAASLAFGAAWLFRGEGEACLAGSTEASLHPLVIEGFNRMGLLSSRSGGAAPFDRQRDGFILGEGAGMMVLETESSARARGIDPSVRLSGWALASDPTSPLELSEEGEGVENVTRRALERAGLRPGDIGYVNAHGTGTRLNDRVEARAIRRLFGNPGPWVSSTKGATGHLLGAAASVEAVIAVKILLEGWAPPTRGLAEIAPDCDVRHVPPGGIREDFRHVLSLNYGLGGHLAALVFSKV